MSHDAIVPPNVLLVAANIDVETLVSMLSGKQFVHVNHADLSESENIIVLARKSPDLKAIIVALVNRGYFLYKFDKGISSFVRHDRVMTTWGLCKNGILKSYKNLLYSIEAPELGSANKLLVIFSSISGKMYQPSLLRHFEQNYKSAIKHVPGGTAILRIPDMGGVCGAFYLDTVFQPSNESNIQELILHLSSSLNIRTEDIVLFGTSKGGTASLYHGLSLGLKFVAVDPIVSDEHYIRKHNDAHFVEGVFLNSKQEKFKKLLEKRLFPPLTCKSNSIVVYSARSPQFGYINDTIMRADSGRVSFINCLDERIKDHPDVASVTRDIWQVMLNMTLLGIPYYERWVEVDRLKTSREL